MVTMIRPRSASVRLAVFSSLCALAVGAAACSTGSGSGSGDEAAAFGYAVNEQLVTTNAGTNVGVSTNAQVLAGRLYPSAHVPGPKGQLIPNSDFVNTQVLPGATQRVIYNISQDANYSDGKPVTCDSYLLAFTAGSLPDLFDSHLPLMQQVDRVECTPGSKQATVVFKEGFGARWRQLFGPGVLMPAHAIAEKSGMSLEELNAAASNRDEEALAPVAEIWKHGFDLSNFDPTLQVSTGPYKIDSVGSDGQVVLKRNDAYVGEKADLDTLTVWPNSKSLKDLADGESLQVAEAPSTSALDWINTEDTNNPYHVESEAGVLTEQLFLSNAGVFYDKAARQAFAACIDQASIASVSSEKSGVEVQPVATRVVRATDPAASQMKDITDPHLVVNLESAAPLHGQTIRVGYSGPNQRFAAMVEDMNRTCQPAGITVVDASADASSLGNLSKTTVDAGGAETFVPGSADAFIQAVDPMSEFPAISPASTDIQGIRAAELDSWDRVETIPLASQPRVFVTHKGVENVVANTDTSGIGWNMNKWKYTAKK